MCIFFTATFPERTKALILYGSYAMGAWSEDHPWMLTEEQYERRIAITPSAWGSPEDIKHWAPSAAFDERLSAWKVWRMMSGLSPGGDSYR